MKITDAEADAAIEILVERANAGDEGAAKELRSMIYEVARGVAHEAWHNVSLPSPVVGTSIDVTTAVMDLNGKRVRALARSRRLDAIGLDKSRPHVEGERSRTVTRRDRGGRR